MSPAPSTESRAALARARAAENLSLPSAYPGACILNWNADRESPLRLIRLRSDAFDVRALIPGIPRSIDAFRALQAQLLARTGAVPLPDREAARGRPYRNYADVESYQREVLQVDV